MAERVIIVPDTNVLLHSQPIDQIPWRELTGVATVEIVLVSQVIRELDAKKHSDSEKLRGRSRSVLSKINSWFPSVSATPAIADGVTVRVWMKEPSAADGLDVSVPDDRIIASASELTEQCQVRIATGDTTMRLKADARGLKIMSIPAAYRLHDDEAKKPEPPPRPVLRAGVLDREGNLTHYVGSPVGLSARHLLPSAEEGLQAAREAAQLSEHGFYGRPAMQVSSFDAYVSDRPPTAESWERYIESIHAYDREHALTVKLIVGIVNEGTAPADDLLVEFRFPPEIYVHRNAPVLPWPPERHSFGADLLSRALQRVDTNESFDFDVDVVNGSYGRMEIGRLLHSQRVMYSVWAELDDNSIRGISIDATVLAGSPPSKSDVQLNVRFEK